MTGSLPGLSGATMGAGATSSPVRDKSTTADTADGRSKQQKRKAPAVSTCIFFQSMCFQVFLVAHCCQGCLQAFCCGTFETLR